MGDSRPEWADAFDGIKALDNSWASRFKASIEPLAVPLGMASRVSEIRDSILPLQKMSFSLPVPPFNDGGDVIVGECLQQCPA